MPRGEIDEAWIEEAVRALPPDRVPAGRVRPGGVDRRGDRPLAGRAGRGGGHRRWTDHRRAVPRAAAHPQPARRGRLRAGRGHRGRRRRRSGPGRSCTTRRSPPTDRSRGPEMDTLRALSARLDEASATLTAVSHTVTASDPAAGRVRRRRPGPPRRDRSGAAPAVDHRHRRPGPRGARRRRSDWPPPRRPCASAADRYAEVDRRGPPPARRGAVMDALDRLAEPGLDLLAPGRHADRRRCPRGAPGLAAAAPHAGAAGRRRPRLPRPAPGAARQRRPRGAPARPGVRRRLRRAHRLGALVRAGRHGVRATAGGAAAPPGRGAGQPGRAARVHRRLRRRARRLGGGQPARAGPHAGRRAPARPRRSPWSPPPPPVRRRAPGRSGPVWPTPPRSPRGCWRCSASRTTVRRRCCASGRRAWPRPRGVRQRTGDPATTSPPGSAGNRARPCGRGGVAPGPRSSGCGRVAPDRPRRRSRAPDLSRRPRRRRGLPPAPPAGLPPLNAAEARLVSCPAEDSTVRASSNGTTGRPAIGRVDGHEWQRGVAGRCASRRDPS